jgi:NAD(P)-dependent dehydrogenase (short-subunit alcohol dehydrogenase family)
MAATWLITGCSSGFGRALAEAALARGHRVIATARRPETLAGLDGAQAFALDITDEASIAAALAGAGAIDVLVNNAGAGMLGTIEQTELAEARAMMEVNYFGALAVIRAALPAMIARGGGRIVNIGSVAGQIGFPGLGYYCASKFALAGLTEALAAEVAPLGIRVTLAELGPFTTGFNAAMAINPPAPHYDLAALAQEAGNADWTYDDPRDGARALVDALAAPNPPRRLILGQPGLGTIELHESRRLAERAQWMSATRLD